MLKVILTFRMSEVYIEVLTGLIESDSLSFNDFLFQCVSAHCVKVCRIAQLILSFLQSLGLTAAAAAKAAGRETLSNG